jgi:hypothetical protein
LLHHAPAFIHNAVAGQFLLREISHLLCRAGTDIASQVGQGKRVRIPVSGTRSQKCKPLVILAFALAARLTHLKDSMPLMKKIQGGEPYMYMLRKSPRSNSRINLLVPAKWWKCFSYILKEVGLTARL